LREGFRRVVVGARCLNSHCSVHVRTELPTVFVSRHYKERQADSRKTNERETEKNATDIYNIQALHRLEDKQTGRIAESLILGA